jgi:hypothetical protein
MITGGSEGLCLNPDRSSKYKQTHDFFRKCYHQIQLPAFATRILTPPPAERERLLRQSVSDDVAFTNPTGDGKGFSNLIEHQKSLPNARGFKTPWQRVTNNLLLRALAIY